MIHMLWWLLAGHALADYPLQGDFLARGKQGLHVGCKVLWAVAVAGRL